MSVNRVYNIPNLIKINNRNNLLLGSVPNYVPNTIAHRKFWKEQFKRIIEGFWFPDDENVTINVETFDGNSDISNKWRFAPPSLYFYGNFGTIMHKPPGSPKTAAKIPMRPNIDDLEWMIGYDFLVINGFSGFEGDDEYTCNLDLLNPEIDESEYPQSCFKKDGTLKEFISARVYLDKIFDRPLGKVLYENEAGNYMLLGSRELGKSFYISQGIILHEIITDGRKYIDDPDRISMQFVGSGIAAKSHSLMRKVRLGFNKMPGAWKEGTKEYIPPPFFKHMSGSISPNSVWKHSYKKKIGNVWKEIDGSSVAHGVFTVDNLEAAAGDRYRYVIIEETGLTQGVLTIHASNEAAQQEDVYRMGSSIYIGTGGNVKKIQESEIMFKDPLSYGLLAIEDVWEGSGKIGRFIPVVLKDRSLKDKNGNTDLDKAYRRYELRRAEKSKAGTGDALYGEMMNYPIKPSEMFLSSGNNRFPVAELKDQLLEAEKLDLGTPGELYIDVEGVVRFRPNVKLKPIKHFPLKENDDKEGCVVIYESPYVDSNGHIPKGLYIAATDPIDQDEAPNSPSLMSTFIYKTFQDFDQTHSIIVAEYTGRPSRADEAYEITRRLLMFYNAVDLYENMLTGFKGYMQQKKSLHFLKEQPGILKKIVPNGKVKREYGIHMTKEIKKQCEIYTRDWLLEERSDGEDDKKILNLHKIFSIPLLQELILYNPEHGNFDRVIAFMLCILHKEDNYDVIVSKDTPSVFNDKFWSKKINKKRNVR